jgi:hypothetical protein
MRHAKEPTYSFVILTFVLILIDIALAYISVKFIPAYGGISLFFIAVAFMILFTLWFGAYGAAAAYFGTLIGSGLLASDSLYQHPEIAVVWAVAGLLQVLIPLAATRLLDVDLTLQNMRDWTIIHPLAPPRINDEYHWGLFHLAGRQHRRHHPDRAAGAPVPERKGQEVKTFCQEILGLTP